MEPIRVPAPPKQAFNKHRRVSDLIRKQVDHFKHLEHKLPDDLRSAIPQHHVMTEDDAARYIASMTALLLSPPRAVPQPSPAVVRTARKPAKAVHGLSLAAAAESSRKSQRRALKAAKKTGVSSRRGKKK
jgi:hypothetical protein